MEFTEYLKLRLSDRGDIHFLEELRKQILNGSFVVNQLWVNATAGCGKSELIKRLLDGANSPILKDEDAKHGTDVYPNILENISKGAIIVLHEKLIVTNPFIKQHGLKVIYDIIRSIKKHKGLIIVEANVSRWDTCGVVGKELSALIRSFPKMVDIRWDVPAPYRAAFLPWHDPKLLKWTANMSLGSFHSYVGLIDKEMEDSTLHALSRSFANESYSKESNCGLSSIIGRPQLKLFLERVIHHYRMRDALARMGVRKVQMYIFEGPPGTGKTLAVKSLVQELGIKLKHISYKDIASDPCMTGLHDLFNESTDEVIFIDEAEKFFGKEYGMQDSPVQGELQQIIDGAGPFAESFEGILILGINNITALAPSLVDRFAVVPFGLPSEKDREQFLMSKLALLTDDLRSRLEGTDLKCETQGMNYREMERYWTNLILRLLDLAPVPIQQKQEVLAYVG